MRLLYQFFVPIFLSGGEVNLFAANVSLADLCFGAESNCVTSVLAFVIAGLQVRVFILFSMLILTTPLFQLLNFNN
jgi:hypothetical protein